MKRPPSVKLLPPGRRAADGDPGGGGRPGPRRSSAGGCAGPAPPSPTSLAGRRSGSWADPAHGLVGAVLDGNRLDDYFTQLVPHPLAQTLRCVLLAAAPGDQHLHFLLDAELAQARRALVKVLADGLPPLGGHLAVEVEEHLREHLAAVGFVRLAAAHDASPLSRTRPRSRA